MEDNLFADAGLVKFMPSGVRAASEKELPAKSLAMSMEGPDEGALSLAFLRVNPSAPPPSRMELEEETGLARLALCVLLLAAVSLIRLVHEWGCVC